MTLSDQKTVVVTGASSGIGQAIAAHLHRSGWRVFGTMRRPEPRQGWASALKLDVASDRERRGGGGGGAGPRGPVDAMVNNAGADMLGAVEETTAQEALGICFKPTSSASTGWSTRFCLRCARERPAASSRSGP